MTWEEGSRAMTLLREAPSAQQHSNHTRQPESSQGGRGVNLAMDINSRKPPAELSMAQTNGTADRVRKKSNENGKSIGRTGSRNGVLAANFIGQAKSSKSG